MFNEEKLANGIFQLDENGKMERKCSSHGFERRGDKTDLDVKYILCLSNLSTEGMNN